MAFVGFDVTAPPMGSSGPILIEKRDNVSVCVSERERGERERERERNHSM